jgi:hypothetical protein
MSDSADSLFLFGLLTFLHLWGGAAIGAGLRCKAALPVLWGLLVGVAPIIFGIERGIRLGSWAGPAWQVVCLLASMLLVATGPAHIRAWLLQAGMTSIMIGSLLMAGGALAGAILFQRGSELLSLALGGAGFMFGAMWFGAGLFRLRGKS